MIGDFIRQDVLVIAHHAQDFENWFFTNFDPATGDILALSPGYIKVIFYFPEETRVHHYRYVSRPEQMWGFKSPTVVRTPHFNDRRMTYVEAMRWVEAQEVARATR